MAIRLLRATVVEPWESVDQVIAEHGSSNLGDSTSAGTAAWHLRHIVEIFRVHARTVIAGLADEVAADIIPSPDAPIPSDGVWNPKSARDELLLDIDRFSSWLVNQDEETLQRSFEYGSPTNLTTMFSVMIQHIIWHAAAVHYWRRFRDKGQTLIS